MANINWLSAEEMAAWRKFVAVVELLPGALDAQLQRDSDLSHFEYFVMAMLSEAPGHALRMTQLGAETNATLPRLSHVVSRLEKRGYLERSPCEQDRRAKNVALTTSGWHRVVAAAPGHLGAVRHNAIDPLDARDISDLDRIMGRMLGRLAPEGRLSGPEPR